MKKLLLILLCVPLIFSCGENEKEIATKEGICIEGDCDNGTKYNLEPPPLTLSTDIKDYFNDQYGLW